MGSMKVIDGDLETPAELNSGGVSVYVHVHMFMIRITEVVVPIAL